MNFLSDTTAPAHPKIIEAISIANEGYAPSYGADPISDRVKSKLRDIFETELELVFTSSGTACNALALSLLSQGNDIIVCHDEAHIQRDERGAPEFYTGGAKLLPLKGAHAKINLDEFAGCLNEWPRDFVHTTPPRVLSLSQLTESGCTYSLEELKALTELAKQNHLKVHMDGARFANALVHFGCTPAQMSWKSGVDILCLGATKNGAIGAEAVILFPSAMEHCARLQARQKRAGHMLAKMRFVATQFDAWFQDDLWLDLAKTSNAAAQSLADGLIEIGAERAHPTHGNEVFVAMNDIMTQRLQDADVGFYGWPDGSARFVTSWCTTESEIEAALAAARA
jgi:threonine aldolase